MREKILTVEDAFWIPSQGIVVTESGTDDGIADLELRTSVIIIFPDGKSVESEVLATEKFRFVSGTKGQGILLKGFVKEDKNKFKGATIVIDTKQKEKP